MRYLEQDKKSNESTDKTKEIVVRESVVKRIAVRSTCKVVNVRIAWGAPVGGPP